MVLSTHAVAGAATALALKQNTGIALLAAFSSHFVLDAIPHWHYKLLSKDLDDSSPFGKKMDFGIPFVKDIFRTGIDFGLGLAVSLIAAHPAGSGLFYGNFWLIVSGAFIGALPDALQVAYYRFPNFKPLFYFQLFHEKIHTKKRLDGEPAKGILQQVILSAVIIFLIYYLH